MKFNTWIKKMMIELEPHYYFNAVEFIIFIIGLYLGATKNKIYIFISIGYVLLIYILKALFEVKNEISTDLKFERDRISSIFIQKNKSLFLFSPYIKKNQSNYEIVLNVSSMKSIKSPKLRVEYPSSISCENIVSSDFLESIDGKGNHKTRIEYTSFNYYNEEELCIVFLNPRQEQDGKYFQFEFSIPHKNYKKMSFTLIDSVDRQLSHMNFNLE